MKRFAAIVLSMILILSMSACTRTKETNITGSWYSDMLCNVLTMNINEGGVYNMELLNEAMIGAWVQEGDALYLDKGTAGETMFSYDADAQTLSRDGFSFTRKKVKAFKPGKTVPAGIEDFAGSWTVAKVEFSDTALPLRPAEMHLDAVIDGVHVILTEGDDELIKEGDAVFAANSLILTIPAADESGKESVYTITKLKNSMISIATDSARYYLEKTVTET